MLQNSSHNPYYKLEITCEKPTQTQLSILKSSLNSSNNHNNQKFDNNNDSNILNKFPLVVNWNDCKVYDNFQSVNDLLNNLKMEEGQHELRNKTSWKQWFGF